MSEAAETVVVGRQGIHDQHGLVGYELQFGTAGAIAAARPTADQITAALLYGATTIGLDRLVGDGLALCRCDRGVLVGDVPMLLPAGRTLVEVADSTPLDDAVAGGCQKLAGAGYRLVLNQTGWRHGHQRLLPMASLVKVDPDFLGADELRQVIEECRGAGVRLIATRVGHRDRMELLAGQGFDYFQGPALDRPQLVSGLTVRPAAMSRVLVGVQLLGGEPDFDEIEAILRGDPGLAYQIMQLASIGRMGESRRSIHTLRDALVLAGTRQVGNWIAVLLARVPTPHGSAHDSFLTTLLRARACELLARSQRSGLGDMAFAAGMVSAFDLLLGVPLDEAATALSLADDLRAAAVDHEGPVGDILADVLAYQAGERGTGQRTGMSIEALDAVFAQAFAWSVECTAAISER